MQCGKKEVSNPKCQACLQGTQQRALTAGNIHTQVRTGATKREQLRPGQRVFSDQYVSSVPGRNYNGRGQSQSRLSYKGGTIFVDAASSYMSIHHQLGFTANETIRSKLIFEREASLLGNKVDSYTTDNGVYTSKEFTKELERNQQTIRLSGVGAHHQNGPAENAIKNISRKARVYMFHAALRWPDHYSKSLWPLAMTYSVHMHNQTPRKQDGLCPIEIWSQAKSDYSFLKNAHPWGCPVYVLDPRLQDGFKIPRWEPRSRRGIFVGFSPLHASTVGLILNPNTNRISPQFHCIYDDYFETVHHKGDRPPPVWEDLVINSRFRNELEEDVVIEDTWDEPATSVAPQDLPVSTRDLQQSDDVDSNATLPVDHDDPSRPSLDAGRPNSDSIPTRIVPKTDTGPQMTVPDPPPELSQAPEPSEPVRPSPRRSSRVRRPVDRFTPDKAHGYTLVRNFTSKLIRCLCFYSSCRRVHDIHYATALAMDPVYGILDGLSSQSPDFLTTNPWMFKSKKGKDPDTPTIKEALGGPHRNAFIEGMTVEIQELESHGTWTVMKRSEIEPTTLEDGTKHLPQIIPLTWAFKIKRWPSGLFRKTKARLCVRGDLQTEGVDDVWDTYAPVASWYSIRMLTVLALQKNWTTKQINFSNAFVQAPLEKNVYVAMPPMFNDSSGIDPSQLCLCLHKSLYGMREAPKLWNDHLEKGLLRCGFTASHEDPGIYYGRGMAIAVYVDDVLFFGPDEAMMEKVIDELQTDGFELKREKEGDDDVYNFLGINIQSEGDTIKMSQHGLIKKFLSRIGMADCNSKETPCITTPLGSDVDGAWHDEKEFSYASAVGMLMYLAGNAHPEIAFAVHQCARFTHAPKQSHAQAVKHIVRYLKGIIDGDHGLIYKSTGALTLNCYVDADFAGLWKHEDDQDPICVRSRTGYVMTIGGCPIHWTSKLQTEVALSTTEAEYIALCQAMREFVPMRWAYDDMLSAFGLCKDAHDAVKSTIFEDNNGALATATSPKMSPRTKHIAVKYHFVRTLFSKKNRQNSPFNLVKINTEVQKADIFTKGLTTEVFCRLRKLLCGY